MLSFFEKFFKILTVLLVLFSLGIPGGVQAREESPKRAVIPSPKEGWGGKADSRNLPDPESLKKRVLKLKKKVSTFSRKETEIIDELNRIDLALNRKRRQVAAAEADIDGLKQDIKKGRMIEKRLQSDIKQQQDYAHKRLNALYRVSVMERMELSAIPDSVFSFFLQQNSLKKILSNDVAMLKKHLEKHQQLMALTKKLETQHKKSIALEKRLNADIEKMTINSRRRGRILKKIRQQKSLALAALSASKEAARNLDITINLMDRVKKPEAAPPTFAGAKGGLELPVQGKIISRYGPVQNSDDSAFTFQSGIDISVDKGEPVMSVFKGRIVFAQWLKGYGNLIIIDHGGHYYTLYAHVEESFKKKGDPVAAREVIAIAGDTGSIKGPYLHFEVRYHGKPVDPMAWLKKGAVNEKRI